LEARLGLELLSRDGQRLVPTDEGERLAGALGEGFSRIIEGVSELLEDASHKPLRISLTPSFAEAWLMPRLGAFWAAHPDIAVEFAPSTAVVDLLRDGFDLAIRYGSGTWPGLESEPLMTSGYVVVAAPGTHPKSGGDLIRLQGSHWILEHLWPEGRRWLSENGIDIESERVTVLGTTSAALQAVRNGHGITLISTATAESDVAAGQLEIIHEGAPAVRGYHIVTRPGVSSPASRAFIRWLKSEVAV
jgi:LysR family glycine cleavage system transcriptional activator